MNRLFEFIEPGLCRFRKAPVLGKQDVGVSTGGPMDRLSVICANILLGQEDFSETLEILLPPKLKCLHPFYFVLTGAHRDCQIRHGSSIRTVSHGEVVLVRRGAELWFSSSSRGFRTVFAYREYSALSDTTPLARKRGSFESHFTFFSRDGYIRILPGPEREALADSETFLNYPWKISSDSDDMGYRLAGPVLQQENHGTMISDAVSDGTIQLTPGGPIVLLYHRQTVGGYPRIFNVLSCDVDFLSQFAPGERIRFKVLTPEEARLINQRKRDEIESFRNKFPFLK